MTQMIYGLHAVKSFLETQPDKIVQLFVQHKRQDKRLKAVLNLAKKYHVVLRTVPTDELTAMVDGMSHQGVIAEVTSQKHYHELDLYSLLDQVDTPLLLILDGVQDPHNLGACLRSADAAGVHAVIVPKDNAAGLTPTVRKVACGAAETVPLIQVTNLARTMQHLKDKGVWLYGAAGEASNSLFQADLTGAAGLVLGSEGKGLRRLTQEHCDAVYHIPMQGSVESLNVSVATGIFLFEALRQRI